jgi:hypothetical protein
LQVLCAQRAFYSLLVVFHLVHLFCLSCLYCDPAVVLCCILGYVSSRLCLLTRGCGLPGLFLATRVVSIVRPA